ncbi:VOC family protein [Halorarum salinum]|uniref:VOC family protein n=1 Tax=Halorarum salinum TaxID=2743089 RepID=A0A7D5QE62_9EURY|nr:VOC family protein [Halobaculum salinum]QLG62661.1 VOC family protein [Halobaculum salinum]
MTPTEFYHVAMKVEDVDETVEFYRQQFDAEVIDRNRPEEGADGSGGGTGAPGGSDDATAVEYAAMEVADKRLYAFDRAPYEATGLVEDLPTGLLHFGFVVDDADAAHRAMAATGVEFVMEPTDFGDLRIAFLADPSGAWVELVEHRS